MVELDEDAIADRIAAKVLARIELSLPAPAPEPLITKSELAKAFSVSPVQIDRYAREGMPRQYVGDRAPRFELRACRAWLGERSAQPARIGPPTPTPGATRVTRRRAS